jgi:hypothetical protein
MDHVANKRKTTANPRAIPLALDVFAKDTSEAEELLLAALLARPAEHGQRKMWGPLLSLPADFTDRTLAEMYRVGLEAVHANPNVDLVPLLVVESNGDYSQSELEELTTRAPNPGTAATLVELVREFKRQRTVGIDDPHAATRIANLRKDVKHGFDGQAIVSSDGLPRAVCALDVEAAQPPVFLVHDLLIQGELALVAGEDGTMKSTIVLQLAAAVAGGHPALERFATVQGNVLIVSAEDALDIVMLRLEAMIVGHGWDRASVLENIHILALADVSLAEDRWKAQLYVEIQRTHAKLVVFDPWFEVVGGEEDSSTDNRPVIQYLRSLGTRFAAAVVVVHHVKKEAREKPWRDRVRGSSALPSASRSSLGLETTDAGIRATHFKFSRGKRINDGRPFLITFAIEQAAENKLQWASARFEAAESVLAVAAAPRSLNEAEAFILEHVGRRPRELNTRALKALAEGTGNSGQQISAALVRLQAFGLIGFVEGPRASKLWYAEEIPNDCAGHSQNGDCADCAQGCPAQSKNTERECAP